MFRIEDKLNQEDIKKIREPIRKTGGFEAAKKASEKHADKAKKDQQAKNTYVTVRIVPFFNF
ncbi:hypothetical protein AKJ36_01740 [candidate division MSBL1 archaeon SCGC-AAA259I07]|uniref:Uncharacterized protein n=1 Tax=candidate division MSBL1 archaeon SCGC-AAA259I07 TaxID=1698266 RepID=A0A133ULD9_9EURY|nr:hypothetical protein AKJ36_01740 [candidate division MSBL1 archaeon SCGC-AAA259I07]